MACLSTINDSCGLPLLSNGTISNFLPPSTPPLELTMSAAAWTFFKVSSPCSANGPLRDPRKAILIVSAASAPESIMARIAATTVRTRPDNMAVSFRLSHRKNDSDLVAAAYTCDDQRNQTNCAHGFLFRDVIYMRRRILKKCCPSLYSPSNT